MCMYKCAGDVHEEASGDEEDSGDEEEDSGNEKGDVQETTSANNGYITSKDQQSGSVNG